MGEIKCDGWTSQRDALGGSGYEIKVNLPKFPGRTEQKWADL